MKASDLIPKKIVDQNAETIQDMMKHTPMSRNWLYGFAQDMVKQGKYEKVWKKVGVKLVPAYRIKRGK